MRSAELKDLPMLYRSDAIQRIERAAMIRFALDEDDLMARAGLAAWRMLLQRWPQAQRIGVICGPGNNGGDGYELAEFARSSGRAVQVLRVSDDVRDGPARRAETTYVQAGGAVTSFASGDALPEVDVWVDALFGIGLHRALDGVSADLVAAINAQAGPVLSLDMPSGVDSDSGHHDGVAVQATVTLCYIAGKPGLFTGRGRAMAGEVVIDPLGLEEAVVLDDVPAARLARADILTRWLPRRARDAHKGQFGHVLCIGGDHGHGGALALCAEAALRTGAGLVSAATRTEHIAALLARRPECMVHAVKSAADLHPLLKRSTVVAIGPGLGRGDWSRELLNAVIEADLPTVLDADALNLLAQHPHKFKHAIWTPHAGEASRLLGMSVADIERDRLASALNLAERIDGTVVWKGAGTVIATPGEIPIIIDAGNPGMAVGGMGDVLTGTIAACLAQHWRPFDAAVCGALLHALAGDDAASEGGERGLLPSDLFTHLRRLSNPLPA